MFTLTSGAIPVRGGLFGNSSEDILLDELHCDGNESSLLACEHDGFYINDCDHSEDAGVRCQGMQLDSYLAILAVLAIDYNIISIVHVYDL